MKDRITRLRRLVRAAAGGLSAVMLLAGPIAAAPRMLTSNGPLEGSEERGVAVFRGIPYAAPPVGAYRWRSPQPLGSWTRVRSAVRFGHNCWQAVAPDGFGPWTHEYVVPGDISEDCLFLNIWSPVRRSKPLPVLVWIHGGGFNSGSGSIPIYDGRALAADGVVVVTINYRVGVFGFLAHPKLTHEAAGGSNANFGLQDIVAALRWVRANIAAVGGDPHQVTIAGQSAGSMAVQQLVASPLARGLFQRAISESGLPTPLASLASAEQQGISFAQEKGTHSLQELRALPPSALQAPEGANAVRFRPIADGVMLPYQQWRAINDVPMLVGFNADEGSAMGPDYGSSDPAKFDALLRTSLGPVAAEAAALYPAASEAQRSSSSKQIRRDCEMAALDSWAIRRRQNARTPVYAYLFAHVMPGPQSTRWQAFHSSEIPYVFKTFWASPERAFTAVDRAVSARISSYWTNFIKTGQPNGTGLPRWPAWNSVEPQVMRIGDPTRPQPLLPHNKLQLMRSLATTGTKPRIF